MKRFAFMLTVAAVLVATGCQSRYTIEGTFEFPEGENSVLVTLVNDEIPEIIDTVTVTEGHYTFKGSVKTPFIGHVEYASDGAMLIIEKGKITVNADGATGTPQNDLLAAAEKTVRESPVVKEIGEMMEKAMAGDTSITPEMMMAKNEEAKPMLLGIYQKIVEEHPAERAAVVAFFMLGNVAFDDDAMMRKYADMLSEENKENPFISDLLKIMDARTAMEVGSMFSDFSVEDGNLDGTPVAMSDYVGKGKYVLVDFWASWCGPCKEEMPFIKSVYEKYAGEQFDVVSVAVWDEREESVKAIDELGMKWHQIVNAQRIPSDLYGFESIPKILLFGPDGTLVAADLRGESVESTVSQYLKK